MLGQLSQSNTNESKIRASEITKINDVIKQLKDSIDVLRHRIDDLSEGIVTEMLTSDSANIGRISSDKVDSDSVKAYAADIRNLITDIIESTTIKANSVTSDKVTSSDLIGQLTQVQANLQAIAGKINYLSSETIRATRAELDEIVTKLFSVYNLNVTEFGANSMTSDYGRIKSLNSDAANITEVESEKGKITELESDSISTKALESDSVSVKQITGTDENDEYALPGILKNARQEGFSTLNLDPQLIIANDDSYLLKVKKNYSTLDLEVADSFALRVSNAYSRNDLTKSTSLVSVNQSLMKEVLGIAEDEDYFYVRIQPHNTNELTYRYTSKEKLELSFEYNGVIPTTQVYYEPAALSETIFLGDKTDNYQFTILGKLSAGKTYIENSEFENITIDHNILTRDYFDEDTEKWVYTPGDANQYLSIVDEYFDEQLGKWITHIAWKTPVDNTEVGPLEMSDRLITANTLGNYNGKVKAFGYEGSVGLEVLSPMLEEAGLLVRQHPGWDSWYVVKPFKIISSTGSFDRVFDMGEFLPLNKAAPSGYLWYINASAIYGPISSPYKVVSQNEVEDTMKLSDWFYNPEYVEISRDEGDHFAFYPLTNVRISLWGDGESTIPVELSFRAGSLYEGHRKTLAGKGHTWEFDVWNHSKTTGHTDYFTGDILTDVPGSVTLIKKVDASGNPITKLGVVDEGSIEYGAGHIHTKELGIKNSIKWSNSEELDQKDYQVWLNGDEPEDEDFDWMRR